MPGASGGEVVSTSIGADWAPGGIVPWQDGVTEATVVMRGLPDGAALTAGNFLVGRFMNGAWCPRQVTAISHTASSGEDTYAVTFEEVVGETVFLVVSAGPTTGLDEPHIFPFGHLTGDVNGDGTVTPIDSLLVMGHINSGSDYDPRYDVDRSGDVSPLDSLIIIDLINGSSGQTSIIRTESVPPPSGMTPEVDLIVDVAAARVILVLTNLVFAYEYPVDFATDLSTWKAIAPIISSTTFGSVPVERDYALAPGGRGFYRVSWTVRSE